MEELDRLCEGHVIEMSTSLMGGALRTMVLPTGSEGHITLKDTSLTVDVPQELLISLRKGQEEGFTMELGPSRVSIEKDFACIGRDEEKNKGLFPNPNLKDGAC
jgi:hypothetical protein